MKILGTQRWSRNRMSTGTESSGPWVSFEISLGSSHDTTKNMVRVMLKGGGRGGAELSRGSESELQRITTRTRPRKRTHTESASPDALGSKSKTDSENILRRFHLGFPVMRCLENPGN